MLRQYIRNLILESENNLVEKSIAIHDVAGMLIMEGLDDDFSGSLVVQLYDEDLWLVIIFGLIFDENGIITDVSCEFDAEGNSENISTTMKKFADSEMLNEYTRVRDLWDFKVGDALDIPKYIK